MPSPLPGTWLAFSLDTPEDAARRRFLERFGHPHVVASEVVKTTDQEVAVVTGPPVGDYDDRNKEALRRMLRGRHEVRRQGEQPRVFTVTGTYIIPQAMGGLFALILDQRSKLIDSDLAAETTL